MLTHPTLDKLQTLKLSGMYHALVEQLQMADIAALSFEERFGLLVDRELTERDTRRLTTRLRQAKLRQTACLEDIDYRHPRGLDKALMARLAKCQHWQNVARVCVGAQGLSRRLHRALPPSPQISSRIAYRERRWTLWESAHSLGQDRLAHSRRLGTGTPQ